MDAYSMTCTNPALRHMSRIYQDLRSIHFQSISGLSSKQPETSPNENAPHTRVSLDVTMNLKWDHENLALEMPRAALSRASSCEGHTP